MFGNHMCPILYKELAHHIEDLVAKVHKEREARERAESDLNRADKEHDSELS
jgi:hypothetical protein